MHLLLLNGHVSQINSNTILTIACERILVFCRLSQLTHLWQPNDSDINKTFKENLKQIIAPFLEMKNRLLMQHLQLIFIIH
jgi:hypothetical protein